MGEHTPQRWHRFAHYQGRWSGFDLIERCEKPKFCIGCNYKHPFCSEEGRIETASGPDLHGEGG